MCDKNQILLFFLVYICTIQQDKCFQNCPYLSNLRNTANHICWPYCYGRCWKKCGAALCHSCYDGWEWGEDIVNAYLLHYLYYICKIKMPMANIVFQTFCWNNYIPTAEYVIQTFFSQFVYLLQNVLKNALEKNYLPNIIQQKIRRQICFLLKK